jgi:hypothetical protein
MAQWVSLSMSNLLPSEVQTIMTSIQALTSVVKTPLEAVSSILGTAKAFLVSLPPLDFISALQSLVESFKNEIVGAGFYLCDMWDYPVKQIQPPDSRYGPTTTYGSWRLEGGDFSETFLTDLADSFDDENDSNRPQFSGSVAMIVIVVARGTLDDVGIQSRDGDLGEVWRGLTGAIASAGRALDEERWRGAWARMRETAEEQASNKVSSRVTRVQQAFRMFTRMTREELDSMPIPMNPSTGESFFEGMTTSDLSWDDDIVPILEAVENQATPAEYPDWNRATLYEVFPELEQIIDLLFDAVLDLFQSGSTIKASIIALIDAIQAKLDQLESYIDMIDAIIDDIQNILDMTGFHGIYLTSSKGVSDLRTQLLSSTGYPFSGKGFYAGMAILAGGAANVTALSTIFAPIAGS